MTGFNYTWNALDLRDGEKKATNYTGKYSTFIFTQRAQEMIKQHDKSKVTWSAIPSFGVEGLSKILDFGYFALVANWVKTRNPEAMLQEPVYLDITANCLIKQAF